MCCVKKIFILNRHRIFSILSVFICFLPFVFTKETCTFINPCKCQFSNGSVIDLSSIGSEKGPSFKKIKPSSGNGTYDYYYNPCYNFKLGESGACSKGVAVCQVSDNGEEYQNCGDQEHVQFLWNSKESALSIEYRTEYEGSRITTVILQCSNDPLQAKLTVFGETKTRNYEMTLHTICACPNGCLENRVSFGTGLVIIFFVFVLMYLFLGIVYNKLVRGAHGTELIPNYEFWKDFPLLVRDGCVYISSGCRNESSYERI